MNAPLTEKPKAWHDARKLGLGGSDANILMAGKAADIEQLWLEKRGEAEPRSLLGILPVQMGVATELLNVAWFERKMQRAVTLHPEPFVSAENTFMRANVDGLTDEGAAVLECKHRSWRFDMEDSLAKYMPQLTHNMTVLGLRDAYLSVFFGTNTWECAHVRLDPFYAEALVEREAAFWACVQSGERPADLPNIAAPVPQSEWRTVDMAGSNEWADAAFRYTSNAVAAKDYAAAQKDLKALVEDDVGEASGHGVKVKRAKNKSLRITEVK